ncbi:MAG: UbiA family prenyltransferase [candidate division Zixibacteria bacterium]|nr:UbiA family prenyltransferase [candidate division Zixibacteria bacterium]
MDFIFFGRPILLIPVWTIYLHFLAVGSHDGGAVDLWTNLYGLAALTLIMMGAYVLNQIFDIETDRINDKLYFLPRGVISIRAAWIWYAVLTSGGLLIPLFFARASMISAILIVVLGVLYSAPGAKWKDLPVAGLLVNAATFGFLVPACAAPGFVYTDLGRPAIPYFMAVTTAFVLTTIPDMAGDAATSKKTVAVALGPKRALWLALVVALLTVWTGVFIGNYEIGIVAGITAVLIVILLISFNSRLMLFTCKAPILLLTLMAAFHFPLYLVLLVLTIVLTRVYYKTRFGIIYPRLS